MYIEEDWQAACARVVELLTNEGLGHTLVIHTQNQDVIREFSLEKPVNRMLVNTPAALGGIGATTNISPALTLGCGAVGGGSSSDNVGPMNLLNIRKIGYGVRSIDELRHLAKPHKYRFVRHIKLTSHKPASLMILASIIMHSRQFMLKIQLRICTRRVITVLQHRPPAPRLQQLLNVRLQKRMSNASLKKFLGVLLSNFYCVACLSIS